jgi:hypothetical protein
MMITDKIKRVAISLTNSTINQRTQLYDKIIKHVDICPHTTLLNDSNYTSADFYDVYFVFNEDKQYMRTDRNLPDNIKIITIDEALTFLNSHIPKW